MPSENLVEGINEADMHNYMLLQSLRGSQIATVAPNSAI